MQALLDELVALERELHHPGVHCSRERLEQLLHPGFWEIGRSGQRYERARIVDYLGSLAAHAEVVATGYAVDLLAPGVALLTYDSVQRGAGGALQHGARRMSLWMRTDAGWQLRYHQGTPAPAAP